LFLHPPEKNGSEGGNPATGGFRWTIRWGSTGAAIRQETVWTQEQCDERFSEHVEEVGERVSRAIGDAPTSQARFDTLVRFAYDVGMANLRKRVLPG